MEKKWIKATCQICGKEFECLESYIPVTCGNFTCLQEANKRNLLTTERALIDKRIAQLETDECRRMGI